VALSFPRILLALGTCGAFVIRAASAQDVATRIADDPANNRLVISIGPVDLPAMPGGHHHDASSMVYPPIATVTVPTDVYLYGFDFDVLNNEGKPVSNQVVHHLNLIDPDHRELFLPISQRIGAVGGETGSQELPGFAKYLIGVPLKTGQHVVVSLMMHNPTGHDIRGATVRYYWKYVPGGRPWPLLALQPFQLDVAFPAGDKSFDLPPGESSKSYEGIPSVPGRILAIGGHLHEMATSLKFEDATTNTLIWEGTPFTDENGNVNRLAVGYLFKKLGVKITTDHKYRVTVSYINPTADTIKAGGMGVVAGVFLPSDPWPTTNTNDSLYVLDRKHYMREVHGDLQTILAEEKGDAAPKKEAAHTHKH
jgi:hypothetical protein